MPSLSVAGKAILIAGASGSGKTTLAERLVGALDAAILRTDDYYRPLDHISYDARCDVNFDAPESVNGELLAGHVRELLAGRSIERPEYDFTRHTVQPLGQRVEPREWIVVEGLFALSYPALSRLGSFSIFVATEADVCLQRRLRRDVAERGRTPEEVAWRFRDHVHPMFLRHVAPLQPSADLTVSGETGDGFEAAMARLTSPL
ncbi:uridine kinase [bacterium]|nr:MAG: uridine kinase [bacterium]